MISHSVMTCHIWPRLLDVSAGIWRENYKLVRADHCDQSKMSDELLATYAGLGTQDGDQYYRGDECLGESACCLTELESASKDGQVKLH